MEHSPGREGPASARRTPVGAHRAHIRPQSKVKITPFHSSPIVSSDGAPRSKRPGPLSLKPLAAVCLLQEPAAVREAGALSPALTTAGSTARSTAGSTARSTAGGATSGKVQQVENDQHFHVLWEPLLQRFISFYQCHYDGMRETGIQELTAKILGMFRKSQ